MKMASGLQICNARRHKCELWQDDSIHPDAPIMKIMIVEDEPKTGDY
jgi:hypothetical protein